MTIDKQKLKALAEAVKSDCYIVPEPYEEDRWYSPEEVNSLEFAAAAKPETILALLAEIERLEGCDKAYTEVWDKARGLQSEMDDVMAERDQLKAENEALCKDAERYRFIKALPHATTEHMLDAAMTKEEPQ